MPDRPCTGLTCCVSLAGYLGERTPRLVLLRYALYPRFQDA